MEELFYAGKIADASGLYFASAHELILGYEDNVKLMSEKLEKLVEANDVRLYKAEKEVQKAILIGLIAGAYSSILISGSLWVILENKLQIKNSNNKKKDKPKKKKVEELSVKGINA